jgi:hypothetical protein
MDSPNSTIPATVDMSGWTMLRVCARVTPRICIPRKKIVSPPAYPMRMEAQSVRATQRGIPTISPPNPAASAPARTMRPPTRARNALMPADVSRPESVWARMQMSAQVQALPSAPAIPRARSLMSDHVYSSQLSAVTLARGSWLGTLLSRSGLCSVAARGSWLGTRRFIIRGTSGRPPREPRADRGPPGSCRGPDPMADRHVHPPARPPRSSRRDPTPPR